MRSSDRRRLLVPRAFTIAEIDDEHVVHAPSIDDPAVLDEIARFDSRPEARAYIAEVQARNAELIAAGLA